MENIKVDIKKDGGLSIVIVEDYKDGITSLRDAIDSLNRAVSNYKDQLKKLDENIKSNKEAKIYISNNIKYTMNKIKTFEESYIKLKQMGFKPKLSKETIHDSNKRDNNSTK